MAKKKILIVDDEQDLVTLLKKRLEANGYETISAYDGLQGLELARKEMPDLILLDILLPHMSGYQMLHKLREGEDDSKDIPVIVISARGRMRDLFGDEEISNFIAKPFEAQELLSKIKEVLHRAEVKEKINKKALIIGDELLIVEPVRYFMESRQWYVFTASNGPLGIERAVEVQPDIVLVQFIMEEMNGLEVCRLLRKMPVVQNTPFIIYSSQDLSLAKEEDIGDTKFFRYLSIKDLLGQINKYLEKYA